MCAPVSFLLPSPVNLIKVVPSWHAPEPIFRLSLDFVKVIVNLKHCSLILVNLRIQINIEVLFSVMFLYEEPNLWQRPKDINEKPQTIQRGAVDLMFTSEWRISHAFLLPCFTVPSLRDISREAANKLGNCSGEGALRVVCT